MQTAAYEMRIRDWSSDVCSSGLMSFWIVPESADRSTPVFSASAMYMAITMGAGPLMVIDVETFDRSMSANRSSMSASVSTRSEERRIGKECVSTCDFGWSAYH